MQTQISTTETSLLSGLLFEAPPPDPGPIDPPDNTGGGGSANPSAPVEEDTTPENQ